MLILAKFIVFGFMGWVAEVIFTGACAAIFHRDRSATATTYLWMHPIYGAAMLGLEWLSGHMQMMPWLARASIYVAIIYVVEYSTGWLLRTFIGRCPWDYGTRGLSISGLIRLDYAPAWFVAALLFEPICTGVGAALKAVTVTQLLASAAG